MRYFDDKAVDPPKRRTRGKGRVIKVRDDRQDTTTDIHGPVYAEPDNRVCDICGDGRDCYGHCGRDGCTRDEGPRE